MPATVQNVIETALGLAQLDLSFRPLARRYYNYILRQQTNRFDWPFFRKQDVVTPFISGQTAYDLPLDYSRSDYIYLIDAATGKQSREILVTSQRNVDRSKSQSPGTPRMAYIDQNNGKIVFETSPNQPASFQLTYFRKGAEISEDGADDGNDIDFQDDLYVTKELVAMLMDYTDDERAGGAKSEAQQTLHDMKLNTYDEDADSKISLASGVHRAGRRPTRGSFGGWNND